ncbi:MAG: chemotaxis protein CheX [Oligoflexales bacterium]
MTSFPQPLKDIIKEAISSFASLNGMTFDSSSLKETDENTSATELAGHIGFTGDKMKGSLTIMCDKHFLETTYPALDGQKANDAELKDWLGEMANLLLGRTKNILLDYGINLSLGTPTIITGKSIEVDAGAAKNYFNFTIDKKPIALFAHFKIDEGLNFEKKADNGGGIKEGDAVLF